MIKSYINKVGFASLLMNPWKKLEHKPGGKVLFSMAVGLLSPYTGSLFAKVDELEPGYCKVKMRHWFWLGNPFGSIHAFALGNLAEMVSGLAFLAGLPADARAIIVSIDRIEYPTMSRGTMTAICKCDVAKTADESFYSVTAEIFNKEGELCVSFKATWKVWPKKK
jgi:acyl-coenzyme A thioesterase PaaI-like protein